MLDESIPIAAQPIMDGKDLQLLNIRSVTGRIEALLSWVPDSALRREAQGTELWDPLESTCRHASLCIL